MGKRKRSGRKAQQQVPEEIQLRILDYLPLASQCRFRRVCKAWESPRLRPESFRGLYILRDNTDLRNSFFLHDMSTGKSRSLQTGYTPKLWYLDCINGLLGAASMSRSDKTLQMIFSVFNFFRPWTWTTLPHPPKTTARKCFFIGMSKVSKGEPEAAEPRMGIENLDDYIFLAVMGAYNTETLMLQVYNRGEWSCSSMDLPEHHHFMYWDLNLISKSAVIRGSVFYYLTKSGMGVHMCSVDLLSEDKQVKLLCMLDMLSGEQVPSDNSDENPKLAVCSGKILLVHTYPVNGTYSLGVEMLNEEEMSWTTVSSLPAEMVNPSTQKLRLGWMSYGGDEIVCYCSPGPGYIYNLVSDSWSSTRDALFPLSYQAN